MSLALFVTSCYSMGMANPTPAPHTNGGSRIVRLLEAAWADIRHNHPELPDVVMITGSGLDARGLTWGHFARDAWVDDLAQGRKPELFVGGERLATGAELTLQTLLHEATHALACVRGVKDCSRQNRYHNHRFVEIAQEVGLTYPHQAPDPTIGYSAVELTDDARARYRHTIALLAEAVSLHLDDPSPLLIGVGGGALGGHGAPTGKTTKAPKGTGGASSVKATCGCQPARIIRASHKVLDQAPITCGACGQDFTPDA